MGDLSIEGSLKAVFKVLQKLKENFILKAKSCQVKIILKAYINAVKKPFKPK